MTKVSSAIHINDVDLMIRLLVANRRTMSARDYDILRSICVNTKKHHLIPILDQLQGELEIIQH